MPLTEEQLAVLVEEYLTAVRAGNSQSTEAFLAAHPEGGQELADLIASLAQVEDLGRSTTAAPARPTQFPESLGDYRLLEKLGSGGMGTVYRAMQVTLQREVAVKILSPSWSTDAQQSEAFENESRLIAGLRHTNIVEVFGAGKEGTWRYYVMSLVHGHGLRAGNLARAFPGETYERAVARVGLQAAEALAYAHARGVLHRDVKPGNLLLDDDGVLHVSDFGLATVLNAGEDALFVTQSHDGTLRYMPPERLQRGENSFAGDQYSLGLTLYELLTRRPAFAQAEPGELIRRICAAPLPLLHGMGELGAIINKAVSYNPKDRYPSMDAMARDLRHFLAGEPVQARPVSRLRRYAMWVRRRPAVALWSHATVLLFLLLFVTLFVSYTRVKVLWESEAEQRALAERNEQIAAASLHRIFTSMAGRGAGEGDEGFLPPSRADARLMQDLMPYYEQIIAGGAEDSPGEACFTLASIAFYTGDYSTAEVYFRRAVESLPHGSARGVEAANGIAAALYAQLPPFPVLARTGVDAGDGLHTASAATARRRFLHRMKAANAALLAMVQRVTPHADAATRLELVRSLMLAARHSLPCDCGESEVCCHAVPGRGVLYARSARLLSEVLKEMPEEHKANLRRVELLAVTRSPSVRKLLSPDGVGAVDLLEQLLRREPESEDLRRLYLRLALRRPPGDTAAADGHLPDLRRAADYARDLLASNPGDAEAILLYYAVRSRYTAALAHAGRTELSTKEAERTLGVLSLLTARSDFTPQIRERLVMSAAFRPGHPADAVHREEEIRTLLKNYDEGRIRALRERLQSLHRNMPPLRRGERLLRRRHVPPPSP